MKRQTYAGNAKRRPTPIDAAIGAPRGARVPQGTSYQIALFGAPSPFTGRLFDMTSRGERGEALNPA